MMGVRYPPLWLQQPVVRLRLVVVKQPRLEPAAVVSEQCAARLQQPRPIRVLRRHPAPLEPHTDDGAAVRRVERLLLQHEKLFAEAQGSYLLGCEADVLPHAEPAAAAPRHAAPRADLYGLRFITAVCRSLPLRVLFAKEAR